MDFNRIQRELDYYKKFMPINFAEERKIFFKHIEKNAPYNPVFQYTDTLKIEDYEDIKEDIKKERGREEIIDAFLDVYLDVADMMIVWRMGDYKRLCESSGEIFGSVSDFDINNVAKEYEKLETSPFKSTEIYSHEHIGEKFQEEFKKRNLAGWVIEYSEANGGNVSIYETEKKVVIRTGATETKLGLECLLSHELDGHAFQAFNAMEHPKYRKWFLSYLGTERQYEGYATFVEINNLSVLHIADEMAQYFVFMVAMALAKDASFYETYKEVYSLCSDQQFSFFAAYKAKRGFENTAQPGCFQKENCYLSGALEIIKLIEEDTAYYNKLSQGCFPLSIVRHIPDLQPRWISVTHFNRENFDYFKNIMNKIYR